ncbi:MAG: Aminopeptidase YwaD [Promethearchaeota archaeon]|nr:MAG: Aminopeptidase YwaD [Candidatus Lokiarchaeota archaeon]
MVFLKVRQIKKSATLFITLGLLIGSAILIFSYNFIFDSRLSVKNLDIDLQYNASNSYVFIKNQTQDIGNRIPGTPESKECVQFFISEFKKIDNDYSYFYHNFSVYETNCTNVLFKMNEDKKQIVILGAHYDSRARATKDISSNRDIPVPGANDGASGCAVLLELARILYPQRENLTCQIWFLFFDAEDQGYDYGYGIPDWDWCEGSERFVNELENFYYPNNETIECMLLFDMVGGTGLQFINEQYSTSSLLDELFAVGRALGFTYVFPINPEVNSIIDDHKAFVDSEIPSADLIINFWNNPCWPYHHTINDTLQHISNESLEITGKTVEQFIYNNYLDVPWNLYKGNYPWNIDQTRLSTQIITQILILIGIISIAVAGYLIYIGLKSSHRN